MNRDENPWLKGNLLPGNEDAHVHTDRCLDATMHLAAALGESADKGLTWVNITTHVRETTPFGDIELFTQRVRDHGELHPSLRVLVATEVKILNTLGDLDLPIDTDLSLLDTLNIADHQFPTPQGPRTPSEVKQNLLSGEWEEPELWRWLLGAMSNAVTRYPGSILAHPLSIIPKVGVDPLSAPSELIYALSEAVRDSQGAVEINNKWQSAPSNLVEACLKVGTPLVNASDAHHMGEIAGRGNLDAKTSEILCQASTLRAQ